MVRDRVFLALLFGVGTGSLLWGLYEIFYVSPTAPSGLFNTVLGLLVLLVSWAYLVPFVVPAPTELRETPSSKIPASPSSATDLGPRPPQTLRRSGARAGSVASAMPPRLPRRPAPAVAPIPARTRPRPRSPPVSAASSSPRVLRTRIGPAVPTQEERELAEALADLPGPVDETLAAATPDEVVRRIDALLRDLGSGEPSTAPVGPGSPETGRGGPPGLGSSRAGPVGGPLETARPAIAPNVRRADGSP